MNGSQVIANPQIGVINAAAGWHFADTADFNGDGKTDLLLLNSMTNGVAIWTMNGAQVTASPSGDHRAPGFSYVAAEDFNADHKADLLFQNSASHALSLGR